MHFTDLYVAPFLVMTIVVFYKLMVIACFPFRSPCASSKKEERDLAEARKALEIARVQLEEAKVRREIHRVEGERSLVVDDDISALISRTELTEREARRHLASLTQCN